uniref:Uncharacterized protein n=1 Tax=Human betaherpesvirus 6 TaxID=10368 RepID=A0A5P9V297_9BETA|nr:hypothetical protein [Human betaherpesvirus 6]
MFICCLNPCCKLDTVVPCCETPIFMSQLLLQLTEDALESTSSSSENCRSARDIFFSNEFCWRNPSNCVRKVPQEGLTVFDIFSLIATKDASLGKFPIPSSRSTQSKFNFFITPVLGVGLHTFLSGVSLFPFIGCAIVGFPPSKDN